MIWALTSVYAEGGTGPGKHFPINVGSRFVVLQMSWRVSARLSRVLRHLRWRGIAVDESFPEPPGAATAAITPG